MCPIHADLIDVYQVTIRTSALIQVETILDFFEPFAAQQIYQEDLAAKAAVALGAQVEIVGMHSGVRVRSVAP
jgi:hypothetical protein